MAIYLSNDDVNELLTMKGSGTVYSQNWEVA